MALLTMALLTTAVLTMALLTIGLYLLWPSAHYNSGTHGCRQRHLRLQGAAPTVAGARLVPVTLGSPLVGYGGKRHWPLHKLIDDFLLPSIATHGGEGGDGSGGSGSGGGCGGGIEPDRETLCSVPHMTCNDHVPAMQLPDCLSASLPLYCPLPTAHCPLSLTAGGLHGTALCNNNVTTM